MDGEAGDATREPSDEVDGGERHRTEQALDERPGVPERDHVEREVNDSEMQEDARDEPPPLPVERARPIIRAPAQHGVRSG